MKIFTIIRVKRRILLLFLMLVIFICSASFYFLNKKRYKILMIGLDGAGWNVMVPIIEEGNLPNIKRLMDNGCWGTLGIPIPTISEVVWTTIATGKPPDIHGITDQLVKDPDTNEMVPPTSNLRRVKAIWNILSEHRKKVGVVGYKVSWPAEKVNGVIISDRTDENNYFSEHYSQPPFVNLCTEEIFNSFRIGRIFPIALMDGSRIFNKDTFMSNAAKYLLKNQKFDFFCLYLYGIDVYSHYYWKYMFPRDQRVSVEDIPKYKDVIRDYYIVCDSIIGDLLKIVDKNTIVILVSDHGFKTNYKQKRRYFFNKVDNLLKVAGLKKFSHNSKTVRVENTPAMPWRHIKNIKIRGDLSWEEFNAVRENVKDILENIKVKETDRSIFRISNDTDFGFLLNLNIRYINQNPTHHLLINGQEHKVLDFLMPGPNSGAHNKDDAIIIMSGKDIRQHQQLMNADIFDITPTVLYLLDVPVAADMYGKVLMGVLDLSILDKKPSRYTYTYEEDKIPISQKPIRSPADEKVIKERLRSLGYIN